MLTYTSLTLQLSVYPTAHNSVSLPAPVTYPSPCYRTDLNKLPDATDLLSDGDITQQHIPEINFEPSNRSNSFQRSA